MGGNRRSQWRELVLAYREPGMTGEIRCLMLVLAESMDHRGYVSVPRSQLAKMFGVQQRRITERIERAIELGLLDRVRRGRPGVTAVYQGLFPDRHGASPRTMRGPLGAGVHGAAGRTIKQAEHGASGPPPKGKRHEPSPDNVTVPVTTPSLSLDDEVHSSNPNGGRERSERRTRATSNPRIRPVSKAEAERDRQLAGLRQLIQQGDAS